MEVEDYLSWGQTIVSNGILQYYRKLGATNDEFLIYLQLLQFQQQGEFFPQVQSLADNTGKKVEEVYQLLGNLQEKKWIALETVKDAQRMLYDRYDLTLVYTQLSQFLQKKAEKKQVSDQKQQIQDLYQAFEQEFSRGLSPIEMEMVASWLEKDHYSPELIQLALKEAVLSQAYNLKYMDRILLSWEKKNIHTKEQVAQEQKKRSGEISSKQADEQLPDIPFAPWMKKGE